MCVGGIGWGGGGGGRGMGVTYKRLINSPLHYITVKERDRERESSELRSLIPKD